MNNRLVNKGLMFIFSMLSMLNLSAQAVEFKAIAGIGWDFIGGDILTTGTSAECTTLDVKANNGLIINAGGIMLIDAFETQASVGYKYGSPAGENGSIIWDTIPVELIQFYRTGNTRIGIGMSYQINSKLIVDVPGTSYSNYYENAVGAIAQLGWVPLGKSYSVDLRYTAIRYTQKDASNAGEINGNVLGVYTAYYF